MLAGALHHCLRLALEQDRYPTLLDEKPLDELLSDIDALVVRLRA
jgi:hypothetical protein